MKLFKKALAILLCMSFLTSIPFCTTVGAAYSPENGEFVFSSESMLSYIEDPNSVDVSFDKSANALKMTVNNQNNSIDPRALLNVSSLELKASDYKSLLIIYKVPTDASGYANTTELFISSGTVTGPTGGKSVMFNITKSTTYTSHIVDLSSLSWWSGKIHSIRIDPFTSARAGDTMYIDSVILCKDYNSAMSTRDNRMAEIYNVSISGPDYSNTDFVCTSYDYQKYTSPFWKGNIVYNEAVYPIKGADGSTVYTLMYTPDEITSVYSSDFSSRYYEGIDYVVNGNQITFLTSGSMSFKNYNYIHPQSNPNGYSWDRYYNRTAAGDGKWEYWGQSAEFFNGYINVSYTHSDTWDHYVPQQRSNLLPKTANAIQNKKAMNVVFFGDSICGGANSSSYRDVYPYAEYWNEMIVSKLRKDYGLRVNATYSAEGGGAAPGLVSRTDEWVTAYNPDLVFIEFGVNDAMNWSQDSSGSASRLKSEYKTAIEQMIAQVRDTLPNCEFVLVAPFYSNIYCHYMSYFEACRDALNEIASATSGVAVADVTAMHESLLEFKDYLDFSGDNMCHPNDFMARLYAQVCLETIVPGGISPYNVDTENPPVVEPDVGNTTLASPGGYGWQWSSGEAYGLIDGYGSNGQDIEFSCDLSLISSAAEEAMAIFYTAGGGNIDITPSGIKLGGRTYAYEWGPADISNWHTVTIKIKNGAASVSIDGETVASTSSGISAHTDYQLFFSYLGCMAIDNMTLKSSNGTVYVSTDFENESTANNIMGGGLGKRTVLAANTVSYDLNGGTGNFTNQIKVSGTALTLTSDIPTRSGYTFLGWATSKNATSAKYSAGASYTTDASVTLYAVWQSGTSTDPTPTYPTITKISPESCVITDRGTGAYMVSAEGTGLTYKWTCSDPSLEKYFEGADTPSLLVSISELLPASFTADIKCTVTNSDGYSSESPTVKLNYVLTPAPTIESISPEMSTIIDTGSAVFTANATGSGLTYSWSCSESALLPFISGTDGKNLSVNIPTLLSKNYTAVLTCTVTDRNGRTVSSEGAVLEYKLTPAPVINAVTPEKATITDTGSVIFAVSAEGKELKYNWTCSDSSLLPYISGADTQNVTLSIPQKLSESITATLTCTVTDTYGRQAVSESTTVEYILTPTVEPDPDPKPVITGDVNGDGLVNAQDVNLVKRYVTGSASVTEYILKAADMNGDGKVNAFDSNIISRVVAGK